MKTEQKFKLHANFWFEISIQDLRDLFCTMGQGSGYWAHSVTVGDIEEDEDGYYLPNQDYEHEGCCAWVKDLTLDKSKARLPIVVVTSLYINLDCKFLRS